MPKPDEITAAEEEKAFGKAALTVLLAAVFSAIGENGRQLTIDEAFAKAESFKDEAVKRYGKLLNLT